MRRLAWTFAACIGDKHQIRLTRPNHGCKTALNCHPVLTEPLPSLLFPEPPLLLAFFPLSLLSPLLAANVNIKIWAQAQENQQKSRVPSITTKIYLPVQLWRLIWSSFHPPNEHALDPWLHILRQAKTAQLRRLIWVLPGTNVILKVSLCSGSNKGLSVYIVKWAASWQNQQNDLCTQGILRSALVPAQSNQSY